MNIEDALGRDYRDIRLTRPFESGVPEKETIEDQSYLSAPELGVSVLLPDNHTIGAIHLYGGQRDGFSSYPYPLPFGLQFDMSRTEVRQMLGLPQQQGEEKTITILGSKPAWDRFSLREDLIIHVEYTRDLTGIGLVTLTRV